MKMKFNKALADKMMEDNGYIIPGMVFRLENGFDYIAVLTEVVVDPISKTTSSRYSLINPLTIGRWSEPKLMGELCETLRLYGAVYLGRAYKMLTKIEDMELDSKLMEELCEPQVMIMYGENVAEEVVHRVEEDINWRSGE